ncbi:MinD/ParA family protein [Sporosarcina pasteurii]|uniref:Cell division inhibitor MinD n=1 Tax=Sporosarcina pasteurii TaxID=1474 RepID=A0A380BGA3_SPOPA|nr:MinD/ParA family protein [Sporosarcina pasteurii]MDS9470600.1 MinD/ParA family protein [Sporosarcina pasteurii]QBQ05712.1 MinD/ParA family protein [Sporosarcina pasteurii]SUJ00875.1 cell division inhibitor MinD [Sporosarcina pasteurii]
MRDQAESLRLKMLASSGELARTIAVVSGKGGVGKSNFSTNFAHALLKQGKKVVIVDMDIGMGNIHILLGKSPQHSLMDYLIGTEGINSIINQTEEGLDFISGGSGLEAIMEWSDDTFERLTVAFEHLQRTYDFVLFDMGAGATKRVIELLIAIDEIIVISTNEPTSITDAYSMMKFIFMKDPDKSFYLVGNRVTKANGGNDAVLRLQFAMKKFLQKETTILGFLPEETVVQKSVIAQTPYFLTHPNALISKRLLTMTEVFTNFNRKQENQKRLGFIGTLKNIFTRGRD